MWILSYKLSWEKLMRSCSYLKLGGLVVLTIYLVFILTINPTKCSFRRIYSTEHTSNVWGNPVETGDRMIATPPQYNQGWSEEKKNVFSFSSTQMFPIIPQNLYESGAILIDEDEFFLRIPLSQEVVKEMAQQLTDLATGRIKSVTMDARNFEGFKDLPVNIARSIPSHYLQNFEKDPVSYAAIAPSFFAILLRLYSGEWNRIHPFPNIAACAKKILSNSHGMTPEDDALFWINVEYISRSGGRTNACIRQGHPSMIAINRDGWKSWSLFSAINPIFFLYTVIFLTTSKAIRAEKDTTNKIKRGFGMTGIVIWDLLCSLGVAILWFDNSYMIPNNNLALAIYTIVLTEWMRTLAESHNNENEINIGWMKAKIPTEGTEPISLTGFFGNGPVNDSMRILRNTISNIFNMKDVPDLVDFTITGPILMVVTLSCTSITVDITSMQYMFVLNIATNTSFFITKRNCFYYLKSSLLNVVPSIPFLMVTTVQIICSMTLFITTMVAYIKLVWDNTVQDGTNSKIKSVQWMAIIWLTGEFARMTILTISNFNSVSVVCFEKKNTEFWGTRNNLAMSTIEWVDIVVKTSICIICINTHINGGMMLQMCDQWGKE